MCLHFSVRANSCLNCCDSSTQYKFISYFFASCDPFFSQVVMEVFLTNCENKLFRLKAFLLVTVFFMFHSVYCSSWFFSDNKGPYYFACSLGALILPEIVFWRAKVRENLNFWRCFQIINLVLKCCLDKTRRKWIHFNIFSLFWSEKLNG